MNPITETRCHNHAEREAAGICMGCRNYYCRECITEHMGKMMCRKCLYAETTNGEKSRKRYFSVKPAIRILCAMGGFFLAWAFFYYLGQILYTLPVEFHEGRYWEALF